MAHLFVRFFLSQKVLFGAKEGLISKVRSTAVFLAESVRNQKLKISLIFTESKTPPVDHCVVTAHASLGGNCYHRLG